MNKQNLIETVARAICAEDIQESIKVLSDEQYESLSYFIDFINYRKEKDNPVFRKHFDELLKLWATESRENNRPIFMCKIGGDITDGFWKDYKRYAEIAIESYDKWLDYKKEDSLKNE
jgi:hypothetical protein